VLNGQAAQWIPSSPEFFPLWLVLPSASTTLAENGGKNARKHDATRR
jgi:hypothetical protein